MITPSAEEKVVPIIRITGSIKWKTAKRFKREVEELIAAGWSEIILVVNSTGGEFPAGRKIYDLIRKTKSVTFIGYVPKRADSMAFKLLQACSLRIMARNATALIHAMNIYTPMTVLKCFHCVKQYRRFYGHEERLAFGMLASRSRLSRKQVKRIAYQNAGEGQQLTAQEALTYGLIDQIT